MLLNYFHYLSQLRQFLSSEDTRADDNDKDAKDAPRKPAAPVWSASNAGGAASRPLNDDDLLDDGDLVIAYLDRAVASQI